MDKDAGKRIREARTKAGFTQAQLAEAVGGRLTADEVSKVERGLAALTEAEVRAIARTTGVTAASLLGTAKPARRAAAKKTTAKTAAARTTPAAGKAAPARKTAAEKKPKTPASAGLSMRVTAAEKRLIELYRLADGDTKKRAAALLKGESDGEGGGLTDMLSDAIGSLLKGR